MFQSLKNAVFGVLGNVPFLKNFVQRKHEAKNDFNSKTRPELEFFHRRLNSNEGFSDPIQNLKPKGNITKVDWNTNPDQEPPKPELKSQEWERDGKEALSSLLSLQKFESIKSSFELNKAISEHIKKPNDNSEINFHADVISNAALRTFNTLVESYKKTFPVVQDSNPQRKIDPNTYVKLMQNYVSRSLNFVIELEGRIVNQVIKADPNSSDLDIAKAIRLHRELSKSIAEKTLLTIMQSFELLPPIEGAESIVSIIGKEMRDSLRTLYLGSKFGIHSKTIVETFKAQVQKINTRDDTTVSKSLMALQELQNAIHGSLVQDTDTDKHSQEIAQLDSALVNNVLENLIKTILKEFVFRHDEINDKYQKNVLRPLHHCKHDLARFLTRSAEIESETQKIVNANKNDKIWQSINLNSETENQSIEDAYRQINSQTNAILGYTNAENIKKIQVPSAQISSLLKGENLDKHFARILHETSLLAAIDVFCSYHNDKQDASQALTLHPNFETIPWLKDFYNEKHKQYLSWIEDPQNTELVTRRIVKELSKLGDALNKIGYFDFEDFASNARYKIVDEAKKLLNRTANLTDMGVLSMTLEIFSTLFSYLEFDDKGPFKSEEIRGIKELVNFLKEESVLIDTNGKQVVAPKRPNTLGVNRANYMKELVGNTGFLILNTPRIIKFLEQSLNNKNLESTFARRDSLLATLLFYILVKYTPPTVNNIDSLKAKTKIFRLALKLYSKGKEGLPVLYQKLCRQVLGLNDTLTAHDPSLGLGLFKSMIIDLESKISEYPKQQQIYKEALYEAVFKKTDESYNKARSLKPSIELADLLDVYSDIESALQEYGESAINIENTLSKLKNIPGPLIKGSKEMIKTLISSDIDAIDIHRIVKFVKESADEDLIHYTEKLLLNTATQYAQALLSKNLDNKNRLIILDSDQNGINNLIYLLEHIKHTGYLLNRYDVSKINIRASTVAAKEEPAVQRQIINNISLIKNLLSRKIALIADAATLEEEVFPGQFEAKRTLLELIKEPEFNFKPAFGSILSWIPSDAKLQEAQEAPYIITGLESKNLFEKSHLRSYTRPKNDLRKVNSSSQSLHLGA